MGDIPDALSVVQAFQDEEGWNDNTCVLLLTDFINAEKLGTALFDYLQTHRYEGWNNDNPES